METNFTSDFFAGNRRRLRELCSPTAPIVVTANGLMQRGADNAYSFSQDANFWYLTGIDEPDIILLMDRDKEFLIVPERNTNRQTFDGIVTEDSLCLRSGIKSIVDHEAGWELIKKRLRKATQVATLTAPPAYIDQYGLYTNPARAAVVEHIKSIKSGIKLQDLNVHLSHLRMVKQPCELTALQTALDITVASMKQALSSKKIIDYVYEYELEAELTKGFRRRGAQGHAFEPIVASGVRACTLHNVANNGRMMSGELVVVDTGAEVEHYAADITRTLSLGVPSRRQQAVHDAVLAVQRYAFDLLQPGVLLREYEQQVEHFMGQQLRDLGLIKTITHDKVRAFYPHATSHFLGLNVHDSGDYDRPLEPGMVLTVEPGIYIPTEGMGIRIEDDIVITASGNKILTDKLSRNLH